MADIDSSKKAYLFLHGRMDLHEKTMNTLESNGFQKENVSMGNPKQAGEVGDYMVQLWPPGPNPSLTIPEMNDSYSSSMNSIISNLFSFFALKIDSKW